MMKNKMSFQGKKFNQFFSQSLSFLVSLVLSLILVIPFVWMVLCSFQSNASDIFMNPPVLPQKFNLDNYITAITTLDILKLLSLSLIHI